MINRERTTPLEITAIPELDGVPMVDILNKRFPDVEFFLENDANAAALGEFYFVEDMNAENYIFITLGTGVGGAAIINKKVFVGGDGNAMEPGHIPSRNGKCWNATLERKNCSTWLMSGAVHLKAKQHCPTMEAFRQQGW